MKHLTFLLITLALCLTGCNNHDETPYETILPINESFLPTDVVISKSDSEFKEVYRKWNGKTVLVNSIDELPEDPIGFDSAYSKISFADQTLILYYAAHRYEVLSYRNRFYRNNVEKTINWAIVLGISGEIDGEDEFIFTRYAILVPKMPEGVEPLIWFSITDHNWDWE